MVITIDGPTASGKSTTAQALAQKLGWYHLNSGLLYRALAFVLLTKYGYTLDTIHEPKDEDLAAILDPKCLRYAYKNGVARVFFNDIDISDQLKNTQMDRGSSLVSSLLAVRTRLLPIQRTIGLEYNIVMDGRDGGSVVFPDAHVKFYLTALPQVRAQRWLQDQRAHGNQVNEDQALQEITLRDARDTQRKISPLIIPQDALVVDNSGITFLETLNQMAAYVRNACK